MSLLDRSVPLLNKVHDRHWVVTYKPPGAGLQPFEWEVVLGSQVGQSIFDEMGCETKLITMQAMGKRATLLENGVKSIQPFATVEIDGDDWAVDSSQTRWGNPIVRLSLQRETLVRDYQAQRNATV